MKDFDNKLLVIGPGSLVGSRFVEMGYGRFELWGAGGNIDDNNNLSGFTSLDITNHEQTLEVVNKSPANFLINFAGATLVDEIEKTTPKDLNDESALNENSAYRVNVAGVKNIIKACKQTGKFPIFISTGFVFDGMSGPYSEDDPIASNPDDVSFYAWTKILAEKEITSSGIECLIIRISYPYRKNYPKRRDFARSFLSLYDDFKAGKINNIYPIFADQTLTPTFVDDLFLAIKLLLEKKQNGIFHITSPEVTTPYEFACELLKVARGVMRPEQLLEKGSIIEFQKSNSELAKRPIQGGERSDKIAKLGFKPTGWKEGIERIFGS